MKAAIEGLKEGAVDGKRPLCIGVTQLTRTSQEAMNEELLIPGMYRLCHLLCEAGKGSRSGRCGVLGS